MEKKFQHNNLFTPVSLKLAGELYVRRKENHEETTNNVVATNVRLSWIS